MFRTALLDATANGGAAMRYLLRCIGHFGASQLVAVLTLTAFLPLPSYGQVGGATMIGTVTDKSGAVIPNAQVSIRDVSTGVVRTLSSNKDGFFTAPNLLPGNYEVRASAPGFATSVRTGITLTVGSQQVLNITMDVGQLAQQVQVSGEEPLVQLASSTIQGVVGQTAVVELPLNGRDWTSLATLQPGVETMISVQLQGARDTRGEAAALTISGSRPQQNNYRLDGISVNDYANGGPGSVLGVTLGVDAIQEFSVLTSNYSAEYGRTSGGVINAVTRSGANSFHGNAFEFIRNSALDARNYFDGPTIPEFRRNQFGGSIGGPIQKDRTFFFGNYEGFRQYQGVTAVTTVPSPDARNGIIHNADGTTSSIAIDPLVKPFLGLWGLPNGPLLAPGNTGIFTFVANNVGNENFGTARIDHTFSAKDSLFGAWQMDKASLLTPDGLNDSIIGNATSSQFIALEETHIFTSELLNSARVGFSRHTEETSQTMALNPLAASPTLGAVPGLNAPEIDVAGLTSFTGGTTSLPQNDFHLNSFQGYDDVVLTKGLHSLKFGVAVERDQSNMFLLQNPTGDFQFGSLTNFLTNIPSQFKANLPGGATPRHFRQTIVGAYIQDDFRWRPNLTLNLGLRYEMSTVPTETQNKLASYHDVYTDTAPYLGSPLFSNPTLWNFEPRVGFAWDPFRNGKTSVRGGFGLFDVLPLTYEMFDMQLAAAPYSLSGSSSVLPPGSFPTGAYDLISESSHLRDPYVEQNPARNYVMQWNLDVQRQLTTTLTASVAYVGNRGRHLPFHEDDMNMVLPIALTSAGYLWPSPIGSGTVLNPNVGRIDPLLWESNSSYDSLQVGIIDKMSHGLQVQGSYTWGKAIDEGSGSLISDPFANSLSSLFFFDAKLRRGLADFNVAQNLTVNFIWLIPAPHALNGFAAWSAAGWQLGGIVQANSGLPFTPLFGADGDPLGEMNSSPLDFPDRLTGPGCHSLINPGNVTNYIKLNCFTVPTAPSQSFYNANCDPTFGTFPECFNLLGNSRRNVLIGPGLANFDFSVVKNNHIKKISENFNVQFRAELFNVFNHANFVSPIDNSNLIDSTGAPVPGAGLIDATSTTSRQVQFGLKLIW